MKTSPKSVKGDTTRTTIPNAQYELELDKSDAVFSDCLRYRYVLSRKLKAHGPIAVFLLHNPSIAGSASDDPTTRRGISFAKSWGCSQLIFVNIWAGIATDPVKLWQMDDPCGPANDSFILSAMDAANASAGFVIAAYGSVRPPPPFRRYARQRLDEVHALLNRFNGPIKALGLNLDGSPKHPLYIKSSTPLTDWYPPV